MCLGSRASTTGRRWIQGCSRATPRAFSSRSSPRGAASSLGGADDVNAAGRVVGDLVGHADEEEALGTRHALVADHDEVGVLLLGNIEERVGRIPLTGVRGDLDALLPGGPGGVFEGSVHILAGADGVRDVAGHLRSFAAQALPRNRLVRAYDLELRTTELRELAGLPHRLGGGVGSVGAYNDALEQRTPP